MNLKIIITGVVLGAMALTGCKPTEKNYKAAYDSALAKREAAVREQMLPATGMLSDDGPQQRIVAGDTVYVLKERILKLDGTPVPGKWAVAVGMFKMDTNAKSGAEQLAREGFPEAIPAKATGGRYFTLVATASTIDSARLESKRFMEKHKSYPYVGLPGAPVLINY